jgi:hypothetical protein
MWFITSGLARLAMLGIVREGQFEMELPVGTYKYSFRKSDRLCAQNIDSLLR